VPEITHKKFTERHPPLVGATKNKPKKKKIDLKLHTSR
jgi:hypothetical protein